MKNLKNMIVNDNSNNIEIVGGKGWNLNVLEKNKIKVPKFFIISAKMYELYTTKKLDLYHIEKKIAEYCSNNFEKETFFAIRSSANIEDSSSKSYAGQFKSFLNIKKEEVFEYVKKCWEYAKQKQKLFHNTFKMAVIVQAMVKSEISGIAFAANPEGILNEAVITAGRGLGHNVVEDKVETTTYYYNLNDDIYYFEKQGKAIELSKNYIEEIINNLKKIKKIYNKNMDVEWAISNDELYILQARPITTLNYEDIIVLDNSNIVENYPNISLPLTQSTTKNLYSRTFTIIFKKLLGDKQIKKYLNTFDNIVESVNGRIYYRISNWYSFFCFLPFSKKIIKIWQDMLGVMDKKIIYNENKIKLSLKIKIFFKAIYFLIKNNKNMEYIEKEYEYSIKKYNEKMLSKKTYTNKELLDNYNEVTTKLTELGALALVNDMYAFIFTSLAKKLSKNKKYENKINEYISNISNLESMKLVNKIDEVTKSIKEDKKIYSSFIKIKTNKEFYRFTEDNKENKNVEAIIEYIQMYGDRIQGELKWETKTYKTDPILLLEKIKNNNTDYYERKNKLYCSKEEKNNLSDIRCNYFLNWCVQNAVKGIAQREMARLNRTRIIGLGREYFLQISENLINKGVINRKEDIFYIAYKELEDYINNGNIKSDDLKEIIEKRKKEYKEFEKIPAYSRIVFDGKIFNKKIHSETLINYEKSNILFGTPVSSGTAIGECLIIENVENIKDTKNKILITKTTDPGFAFLIKDAKGLISERGSLLSHTAIISRELGIPAVVNVKNATNILKNGDKIKIDANKGEVEIL